MSIRSFRWRRRLKLGLLGFAPILAGLAVVADGLRRAHRIPAWASDPALVRGGMSSDQQVYPIELVVGGVLVVLGCVALMNLRRRP